MNKFVVFFEILKQFIFKRRQVKKIITLDVSHTIILKQNELNKILINEIFTALPHVSKKKNVFLFLTTFKIRRTKNNHLVNI